MIGTTFLRSHALYPASRFFQETEMPSPLLLIPPLPNQPQREPLRHIVLGSHSSVQHTIHQLHSLGYSDQSYWSQLITIPSSGIMITPHQGEVMAYLVRWSAIA